MATATETVHGRIEHARTQLTPGQIAAGLLVVAGLAVTILFVQDPLVHDSLHTFRHTAGITCH